MKYNYHGARVVDKDEGIDAFDDEPTEEELRELGRQKLREDIESVRLQNPETPIQPEYVDLTRRSSVYPEDKAVVYLALGLNDEAGEVAGAVKKHMRGDYDEDEMHERVESEIGDVFWYLTRILDEIDVSLDEVRAKNYEKIEERMETESIRGDGEGTDR